MSKHPGLSLVIAIGRWCRPSIRSTPHSLRVCIGFVAFTLWLLDVEALDGELLSENKSLRKELGYE